MALARAALLSALLAWLAACASSGREATLPRELLLEAARECERRFLGLEVVGLDRFNQVEFRYRTPGDQEQFITCYQERARSKVETAMAAISSGRLSHLPGDSGKSLVRIHVERGAVLLTVRINDLGDHTLLLDTGAGRTVLKPTVVERLGMALPPGSHRWPFTMADGRVVRVPFVRLHALRIGEFSIEDLDVGVFDVLPGVSGVDGILGNDVLGHFRIDLDRQFGLLTLTTATATETTASSARSSDAEPPLTTPVDWKPGHQWHFRWEGPRGRGTFVWTVTAETDVDGNLGFIVKSAAREIVFVRKEDTLGWHLDRIDGEPVERASPPDYFLTWPLNVGKTWEYSYTWEDVRARRSERRIRRCSVEAAESIVVPAGTFDTFRVTCRNRLGELRRMYWFAEVARIMVRDRRFGPDGLIYERELTGYKLD